MLHDCLRSPLKRSIIITLLTSCLLTITGCGYGSYYMRKAHWRQTFEFMPSVSALNQVAPENSLVLAGHIIRLQNRQDPLLLVAVSNKYRENEKVALVQIQKSSLDAYMAFLPRDQDGCQLRKIRSTASISSNCYATYSVPEI